MLKLGGSSYLAINGHQASGHFSGDACEYGSKHSLDIKIGFDGVICLDTAQHPVWQSGYIQLHLVVLHVYAISVAYISGVQLQECYAPPSVCGQ